MHRFNATTVRQSGVAGPARACGSFLWRCLLQYHPMRIFVLAVYLLTSPALADVTGPARIIDGSSSRAGEKWSNFAKLLI